MSKTETPSTSRSSSTCCGVVSDEDNHASSIHAVDSADQWNSLLQPPGVVLVCKFSAPWCKPCQAIQSVFEELAVKNRQLVFCTANVDDVDEEVLEDVQGISLLPTFVVMDSAHRMLQKYAGSEKAKVRDLVQQAAAAVAKGEAKKDI